MLLQLKYMTNDQYNMFNRNNSCNWFLAFLQYLSYSLLKLERKIYSTKKQIFIFFLVCWNWIYHRFKMMYKCIIRFQDLCKLNMLLYLLWKIADSNKYEYDICMKGWVKWGLKRTREDYQKGHIWRHRFLRCDRYYVSNYEIRNKSTSELLKYQ